MEQQPHRAGDKQVQKKNKKYIQTTKTFTFN